LRNLVVQAENYRRAVDRKWISAGTEKFPIISVIWFRLRLDLVKPIKSVFHLVIITPSNSSITKKKHTEITTVYSFYTSPVKIPSLIFLTINTGQDTIP